MSNLAGRGLRLVGAALLLLAFCTAALSPLVPVWLTIGAACLMAISVWRAEWAVLVLVALVPWGARLADVPVRATEYLCASFVIGWLLRVDRPLRLAGSGARNATIAALVYGGLAVVSWMRVARETAGAGLWLDLNSWSLLPADYLVSAGRDPHTAATLQILLGVATCIAVSTIIARDGRIARRMVIVLAVGAVAAAVATVIAVPARYWLSGDANELIRYFGPTRSRYSFHVSDVNAAGSHFILGGLLMLGVTAASAYRRVWQGVGLAVLASAVWIGGSRAAMVAGVALAALWALGGPLVRAGWRWPSLSGRTVASASISMLLVLVLSPAFFGNAAAMTGSASRSMSVREEFLVTSTRMLATAPMFGVGVGTYYQRSSEFMPPGIRALYGRENAHDYFLQTAAELGLAGAMAFVWWLGAALAPLWRRVDRDRRPSVRLALLLGCIGYLLTCVTGHPLLVVEVSVPFWAALGVAMSDDRS